MILLSVDSLRADMPWAGYPRPIAPHLTEFEKTALDYTKAYSISSYTSMSLGGLLGGRLPSELRRSGYFFGTYQHDVFFPKLLQQAGVHTMGVMAHMYFKAAGFEQGFDEWTLVPGVTFDPNTDRDITSPQSEETAEKLLGDPANGSRRFFFWAHFLDPHDLYMRHDGIDWGATSRDRYDGEVTFTDGYIGKLLDFIASQPWASRTVVIVTSDHGEEFGEHNMTRHGFELWQTLIRVPLMIRAPGGVPRRVDEPRSAIDLAPTILDFFGVAPDPSFEGKSLVHEVYGGPVEPRDVVVDLPVTSDNRQEAACAGSRRAEALVLRYRQLLQALRHRAGPPREEPAQGRGACCDARPVPGSRQGRKGSTTLRVHGRLPQQRLQEVSHPMRIVPVPCLEDNYAYLLIGPSGEAAIVDASEAPPVREALQREGASARAIWCTHHHWDHVGGNEVLATSLAVEVVGHVSDRGRLPGLTKGVDTGDVVSVGELSARCLHIPGHTLGAVAYLVESGSDRAVFTGDTLFSAGCGRLFEGTPAQMHESLKLLLGLPGDTRVYCGHEYTESNLRFAAHLEPGNTSIEAAQGRAAKLRGEGAPTIGTTLDEERRTNPFLRVESPAIREKLAIPSGTDDVTAFAAIRSAKDRFR